MPVEIVQHMSGNCTITVDMDKRSQYLKVMCDDFYLRGDPAWATYLFSQGEIAECERLDMIARARLLRKRIKKGL